jgi:hypothetical protein
MIYVTLFHELRAYSNSIFMCIFHEPRFMYTVDEPRVRSLCPCRRSVGSSDRGMDESAAQRCKLNVTQTSVVVCDIQVRKEASEGERDKRVEGK